VDIAHWMLRNEGMFIGSSSAMNLVGAAMAAQQLPENSAIVTIVCDSGQWHLTGFWNRDFIVNQRGFDSQVMKQKKKFHLQTIFQSLCIHAVDDEYLLIFKTTA